MRRLLNFILFQVSWFACVLGAANSLPWLGVLVTLMVVFWHLFQAKMMRPEIILMLTVLVIGGLFDQALLLTGLLDYAHHGWNSALVPVWILALWLAFASVLNVSLRWMREKYLLGVLFGAVGGPLAYLGAEKLGAVTLHSLDAMLALSLGWAVITPILLLLAKRFDGFVEPQVVLASQGRAS